MGGNSGTDYGHGALLSYSGSTYDPYNVPGNTQSHLFHVRGLVNGQFTTTQQQILNQSVAWVASQSFASFRDSGAYNLGAVINDYQNPGSYALQDVTLTSVTEGPTGTYTLTWAEPAGTQSYRVKWCCATPYGAKIIVNSGGFSSISPSQP